MKDHEHTKWKNDPSMETMTPSALATLHEQPMPTDGEGPTVVEMVKADLDARMAKGIETYGTPLRPFNGRSALRDLYEELLDGACYARQRLEEAKDPNDLEGERDWERAQHLISTAAHLIRPIYKNGAAPQDWLCVAEMWLEEMEK